VLADVANVRNGVWLEHLCDKRWKSRLETRLAHYSKDNRGALGLLHSLATKTCWR
jgi:hypothetical protein